MLCGGLSECSVSHWDCVDLQIISLIIIYDLVEEMEQCLIELLSETICTTLYYLHLMDDCLGVVGTAYAILCLCHCIELRRYSFDKCMSLISHEDLRTPISAHDLSRIIKARQGGVM